MIINLLSSPRNVSTAFMYAFAQRKDTKVIDEPFYGHYLNRVDIEHPGKEEIIEGMESDHVEIVKHISELNLVHKHVFVKNMAHHLFEMDTMFMNDYCNLLFIRNPAQIITSFDKVIENPTLWDIGVKHQLELYESLIANSHIKPIVIDSADLISNPPNFLNILCQKMGISFDENMLSWKQGGIPEDGIWAKYWYSNVHASTGFKQKTSTPINVPKHLQPLLDEAMPYYFELKKHALKA
jgi:hypothetical protein